MNKNILLTLILIVASVALRILNTELHWWNFTPFIAIALFSGSAIKDKRLALVLPLATFLLSDVYFQLFTDIPGFYGMSQIFTYVAYVLAIILGFSIKQFNVIKIGGYTIGASLLFFIVSNLGVWLDTTYNLYTKDFNGLVNCFTAALPFYKSEVATSMFTNSLVGNVVYAFGLFGVSYLANKSWEGKKVVA